MLHAVPQLTLHILGARIEETPFPRGAVGDPRHIDEDVGVDLDVSEDVSRIDRLRIVSTLVGNAVPDL